MTSPRPWKGQQRASRSGYSRKVEWANATVDAGPKIGRRDVAEGDGGENGIVLPLDMIGDGLYEV